MHAQRPGSAWARTCWRRIAQPHCAPAPALLLALLTLACVARPADGAKPCASRRAPLRGYRARALVIRALALRTPTPSAPSAWLRRGIPRRRFLRVVSREKRRLCGRAAAGCEYYTNCAACVADTTCGWCAHASRQQQRPQAQPHAAAHPHVRTHAGVATTRTTPAVTASRCRATTTCVRVVTRLMNKLR